MAQTQKTLAANYTALADSTTADILAVSIRDAIESVRMGHGEIAVTSSTETTIGTQNTFVQVAGTYTLSGNAHNWDMNTSGRLRYLGPEDRVVHIAGSFSLTSPVNNKTYRIAIAKNGTPIAVSEVQRKLGISADVGSGAAHSLIDVATNDYISMMVTNSTDTTNITFVTLTLSCIDMVS